MKPKRKLLYRQLSQNIKALDKARFALDYSYQKCVKIEKAEDYDLEKQENFEALTARFARASDILTQKAFKSLFALLQENIRTRIDAANFLEKIGIVESANDLLNIRELRNQIAHDYVTEDLNSLYMDVLHHTNLLGVVVDSLKNYVKKEKSNWSI